MRAVSSRDRFAPTTVVLGASGFIGRNVCAALAAEGWSVAAVVRRDTELPPGCRPIRLDLADAATADLAALLAAERPRLVVNAAGSPWAVTDDQLTAGNVTLVARLVEAVQRLADPVRVVHIGSAYEYGNHPGAPRLAESLVCRPIGQYAQSKLAGTTVLTEAVAAGRIDAVVLRIGLSVGPHANRRSLLGGLAHQLAARPAALELPPIAGARDIIDSRDVADAVLRAVAVEKAPPVINIGTGVRVPLTDAVDTLVRVAGTTAAIVRSPGPVVSRSHEEGAQPLDIDLARAELDWSPVRSLDDSLRALWESVTQPVRQP
ncbi:NAD-dependent epimerase/dehydratase family protein [Streptomyces sp. NPDC057638]|uniref:NAD-dependent epimerase/dehydratase family protein n=1 Tax=Streptomyces sp. NPDC057638 TaxID=3346190 RepID=UPI0036B254A1